MLFHVLDINIHDFEALGRRSGVDERSPRVDSRRRFAERRSFKERDYNTPRRDYRPQDAILRP